MVVTSEAKKGWGKLEVDDLPRKGSELYDIDTVGWWQELHQAHKNARLIGRERRGTGQVRQFHLKNMPLNQRWSW